MRKIDEYIEWYEQHSTGMYDDIIRIELNKINALYDAYEDHSDELFVNEMIEAFSKIIDMQREKIISLEAEGGVFETNLMQGFQNDKQLQEAFTSYCLSKRKSSYTVNDYCSRIKNTWNKFYAEYQKNDLPKEIIVDEEMVTIDNPLLNAYHHTDELNCYISMKIVEDEGNRNLANARAALNKFEEFVVQMNE